MRNDTDASEVDRLVAAAEVGELFGVKAQTIRSWLWSGDPRLPAPAIRRPNYTRWRLHDVRRRIAELTKAG